VSIVRVGLSETKYFAEGYDAIFGKKERAGTEEQAGEETATPARAKAKGKGKAGARKPARKKK
jgi:hypothetical protein